MSSLSKQFAMGFGLALILALLTGCPQPNPTPKPDGPGPTPKANGPGPTPKAEGFDPDDFEATLRWMALVTEPSIKADAQGNKLLADERLGEAHAQLAKLAGRKVNWRIKVAAVTDTTVALAGYDLRDYLPAAMKKETDVLTATGMAMSPSLYVSAVAASTPPSRLTPGGNWLVGVPEPDPLPDLVKGKPADPLPGFVQPKPAEYFTPGLEIGKVISKARAKNLPRGEKVPVSGKIAYCVCSGVTPPPYRTVLGRVALCIVEAKSPD